MGSDSFTHIYMTLIQHLCKLWCHLEHHHCRLVSHMMNQSRTKPSSNSRTHIDDHVEHSGIG